MKKYILGILMALSMPVIVAYAAPALSVGNNGSGSATINVTGADANTAVILYYNSAVNGGLQSMTVGTTGATGSLSTTFSTTDITNNSQVFVIVNGSQSNSVTWSNGGSSGYNIMFNGSTNGSSNITTGQNGTVTLSGGSGSYYISSNSNAGGVTPTISGNTLTLYGAGAGQASIVVCSTGGGCGTIITTVTTTNTGFGSPTLSQTSLNVNQGSQGYITLSGGSSPYTVSSVSGSGVSTTISGNTLYVNGNVMGTNVINVCSSNGNCTPLSVNVQSANTTTTGTGGQISFMLPLTVGQNAVIPLSGGVGSYYLQSPMSSPALASINGSNLVLNGQMMGSGTVTICQTGGTMCMPLMVMVSQATTPTTGGTGSTYPFTMNLSQGMSGTDVMELQNRLAREGFFTATATGYYGPVTVASVRAYQSAHGISAVGNVGPQTRAMLNQ